MTNKKRKRRKENRRMWKCLGIAAVCALSMLACGCADLETETDAESAMSSSEISQKAIQALNKSLEKEQGRQIEGMSGLHTNGTIELQEQKKVSVISVDDFLAVVKEKAAEGTIKGWNDVVYTKLTLAYCVDSMNQKYFPVWLLYPEDTPNIQICVNAQTGELILS